MCSLRQLSLLVALCLSACQSADVGSIPEPLPEALEWARPSKGQAGAFLGLRTRENDSGALDTLFFEPGVKVIRVVENSPAEGAGFVIGDVVLGWGDHQVDDPEALESLVQEAGPGTELRIKVQRKDTVFEVPLVLGRLDGGSTEEVSSLYRVDPTRSRAGWKTGRGGAVLVSSAAEGPFLRAGVALGSVVLAVNGGEVLSARDLIRTLEAHSPGERVEIEWNDPDGARHEADVTLQEQPRKMTGFQIPILAGYEADADGEETSFVLIDLYIISLFRYTRLGAEKEWRFLRWIQFSSGVGELSE